MAHQSVSAELQRTLQAAALLFSAGGPRDLTASESPFSYLMSTLTLPQIRARNKGSFNRVGVAWTGKDCLVDDCLFSSFCFSFLRARLLRTIFRRSAQGNSTFVCGLRAEGGKTRVRYTEHTRPASVCLGVCLTDPRPGVRLRRRWGENGVCAFKAPDCLSLFAAERLTPSGHSGHLSVCGAPSWRSSKEKQK